MSLKERVKVLLKKTTGLTCYRRLPFGVDVLYDLSLKMKGYRFQTLLDVGANRGQSARYFRKFFPTADIHCVEPIKETFEVLERRTSNLQLFCHNVALGSKNEEVEVKIEVNNKNSTRNTLIEDNIVHNPASLKTELVQVLTLKDFCESNNINRIDFLKIDTEGYDLEVLKGATALLKRGAIGFIQAEVSMNPRNTFHADFVEVKRFLEKFDYMLFGVYEQKHEPDATILRRSNVVFVSEKLAKANQ